METRRLFDEQSIRDALAAVIDKEAATYEPVTGFGGTHEPLTIAEGSDMAERIADRVLDSPVIRRIQAEAEARAYRHAADVVHSEARWQWEQSKGHVPGAQIVAQRMQVIEASLKGFADRIERGETA